MSCRILIRKCEDPRRAEIIADAIARQAGYPPETIRDIITRKTICIRKKANDDEAFSIKSFYEALGATVVIEPLESGLVAAAAAASPPQRSADDDDDDERGVPATILSDAEFARRAGARTDIFFVEKNRRVQVSESVCMVCAVLFCMYLGTREQILKPDFIERDLGSLTAVSGPQVIDRPDVARPDVQRQSVRQATERKTIERRKPGGREGSGGGGGDPRARVTKRGLLGLVAGQITGTSVASAELVAEGGFTREIDALLNGMGGFKSFGSSGVGRKGEEGIGFGPGYNSGTGGPGGPGGIDDLLASTTYDALSLLPKLKDHNSIRVERPEFTKGGPVSGGRSKLSINRVVMQNIAALRYAYNKRLREKPGLKGRITIKFAIDEFGNVIFCQLEESTMTDQTLEVAVVDKVKRWKFERIDKPGDVTEVVYPFVFSQ
jgi:TonB family protein